MEAGHPPSFFVLCLAQPASAMLNLKMIRLTLAMVPPRGFASTSLPKASDLSQTVPSAPQTDAYAQVATSTPSTAEGRSPRPG